MYVHIHIHICIHMYIHIHTYAYSYICICIYVHVFIYIYIYMYVYIYIHTTALPIHKRAIMWNQKVNCLCRESTWNGKWFLNGSTSMQCDVAFGEVVVANFTDRFVKDKLRGKSIVFIGYSLSRYQYLNLVYFLATGKWSSPHSRNEHEKEHALWQSFYSTTAQRNRNEICDCYRRGVRVNSSTRVENGYLAWDGIKVSYMQYCNKTTNAIRSHDHTWLNLDCIFQPMPNQTCQTGCQPGTCTQETGIFLSPRDLLMG